MTEHRRRRCRQHGVVVRATDLVALRVDDRHLGPRLLVQDHAFCASALCARSVIGRHLPRMRGN